MREEIPTLSNPIKDLQMERISQHSEERFKRGGLRSVKQAVQVLKS
jgi:hypothetical protein